MDVRPCKRCKKLFQYITGPIVCPRCKELEEKQFQTVKDYLRAHPGENMTVVSQETEVPVSLIEAFLRQGRLEIAPGSAITLHCEVCGTAIKTGKYCNTCKANLVTGLSGAADEIRKNKEVRPEAKMRSHLR